jgi:myosin heavy subunit
VYNEFVFGQEIKQYENEGVDASNITYTDNVELLQLLDMKPMGIFW